MRVTLVSLHALSLTLNMFKISSESMRATGERSTLIHSHSSFDRTVLQSVSERRVPLNKEALMFATLARVTLVVLVTLVSQ